MFRCSLYRAGDTNRRTRRRRKAEMRGAAAFLTTGEGKGVDEQLAKRSHTQRSTNKKRRERLRAAEQQSSRGGDARTHVHREGGTGTKSKRSIRKRHCRPSPEGRPRKVEADSGELENHRPGSVLYVFQVLVGHLPDGDKNVKKKKQS